MNKLSTSKLISIALAILIAGGSFGFGFFAGAKSVPAIDRVSGVANKEANAASVDFSPFWEAWNILNEKFVSTSTSTAATDQEKVWGAIAGLTEAFGDPYTVFLPPEEAKLFDEDIAGNFVGIGIEVGQRDDVLTVISPLKGTPAEKAGVTAGDKILKIDDELTANMSIERAIKTIRGKEGTDVRLTLLREGVKDPFEVTIRRATINVPVVETELRNDGIFVIRLYSFSANSVDLFRNALRAFVESKKDKLVLDLRGNPGGFLEAAIDMASWFLPTGKVIVREDFGGKEEGEAYRSKGYDIFTDDLKFVILIDGGSASASEILAGALQEHGVAELVGTKTFGKGSVQELIKLTPETSLKVTIARWLTPNGRSISEKGLDPDVEVKVTPEDIKARKDPQLAKAVELLLKK